MEVARMNYYFTGILILMLTALAFCAGPAYPRNEYLNEYGVRCGEFETRVQAEDRETDYPYGDSDYESDNYSKRKRSNQTTTRINEDVWES